MVALLPKKTTDKIDALLDTMKPLVELSVAQMQVQMWNRPMAVSGHIGTMPGVTPPEMTDEEKKLYDGLMTTLEPEIKRQTEELVKTEIRNMMLLGGNWTRVKEFLKLGKVPKIVRKREGPRDPLFLQFGDGVADEIEEFRILG